LGKCLVMHVIMEHWRLAMADNGKCKFDILGDVLRNGDEY